MEQNGACDEHLITCEIFYFVEIFLKETDLKSAKAK